MDDGKLAGTELLAARGASPEVDGGEVAGTEELAAGDADSEMNDGKLMSKVTT